jgi:hypothetical protein
MARSLVQDEERSERDRAVSAWARRLDTRVLHCRELQHSWKPAHAQLCLDGGWERTLVCIRCSTKKRQMLDAAGRLVGTPRYEYADGYLPDREEALGRLDSDDRATLRLTAIARQRGQ